MIVGEHVPFLSALRYATPELYGWAGWDQREQAQALATYFTNTALTAEESTPFREHGLTDDDLRAWRPPPQPVAVGPRKACSALCRA